MLHEIDSSVQRYVLNLFDAENVIDISFIYLIVHYEKYLFMYRCKYNFP